MKPILLLAGLRVGRRLADGPRSDPGVEANARLTGYVAAVLPIPLVAEVGVAGGGAL